MRLIKFCKKEHNIALGSDTLQLGTFRYYREYDPDFAIADTTEGFVHYLGPEKDLAVGTNQLNSVLGGALIFGDPATVEIPPNPANLVVEAKFGMSKFKAGEHGFEIIVNGDLDIKLYHPNCFIFCASVIDGEVPDPTKISREYDSFYEISAAKANDFANTIKEALKAQVSISDLANEEALSDGPLIGGFDVLCFHRPVSYVPDKEIRLNTVEDFELNHFRHLYFDTLFTKHVSYASDGEYRFVFLIIRNSNNLISVCKTPKILDMKPIADFVLAKSIEG